MRSSRFTSETRGSRSALRGHVQIWTEKLSSHGFECHCEQFISAVLFDCHCNFRMTEPSETQTPPRDAELAFQCQTRRSPDADLASFLSQTGKSSDADLMSFLRRGNMSLSRRFSKNLEGLAPILSSKISYQFSSTDGRATKILMFISLMKWTGICHVNNKPLTNKIFQSPVDSVKLILNLWQWNSLKILTVILILHF